MDGPKPTHELGKPNEMTVAECRTADFARLMNWPKPTHEASPSRTGTPVIVTLSKFGLSKRAPYSDKKVKDGEVINLIRMC